MVTAAGLADGDQLHPVQQALLDHDGFQCGYCTPGQVCSAVGMLDEAASGSPSYVSADLAADASAEGLDDAEIRERMSGNLCRCGAYVGILDAVREVAQRQTGAAR
ncbi:MAG TPA: 2Fe-2S iron-sulfur cluster-binding protein [Nocardioidaceae bacterium]|nr:2Fe-2S iron-sulfur cluster-binding protein [Nocardioidaceae bacterium]